MAPVLRSDQPNPFMMNHVIKRICEMRHLKLKDLQKFRSVCRAWNLEATKTISSKTALNLDLGQEDGAALLTEIMNMIHNPNGNFPVPTKIRLSSTDLCHKIRFLKFLIEIGNSVEDLEDTNWCYDIIDSIQRFLFPKLKKFTFTVRPQWLPPNETPYNYLYHRILRDSPLLEEVSITWGVRVNERRYTPMDIEHDLLRSIPCSLKKLSLSKPLTRNTAELFASIKWTRLNTLKLNFMNSSFALTAKQFSNLFQECHNTLTELSVINYKHNVEFPVFSRVTTLTLGFIDGGENVHNEHNLKCFSYHFPAVKTLDITLLRNISVVDGLFPDLHTVSQVETCQFPFLFTPDVYIRLCKAFNGLKNLHVIAIIYRERTVLSTVFAHLPDLESLHISFLEKPDVDEDYPTCLDSIFTGIDISKLCIDKIPGSRKRGIGWKGFNIFKTRRGPAIVDLKKLKALHIRSPAPFELPITDVTGYLALTHMESLKVLKMDNFKLSGHCLSALKRRYGDIKHTQLRSEFIARLNSLPQINLLSRADALAMGIENGVLH